MAACNLVFLRNKKPPTLHGIVQFRAGMRTSVRQRMTCTKFVTLGPRPSLQLFQRNESSPAAWVEVVHAKGTPC